MSCAAGLALLGAAPAQEPAVPSGPVDSGRLEVVENLSESLANDLLALSVAVRNRDLDTLATFFPETVTSAGLPTAPGTVTPELKWISNREWAVPAGEATARDRSSGEVVGEWSALLEHFSEIGDARFKVKGGRYRELRPGGREHFPEPTAAPGAEGTARVAFCVLGRNQEGQREWLRGPAKVAVRKPWTGAWRFRASPPPRCGRWWRRRICSRRSRTRGGRRHAAALRNPGERGLRLARSRRG